MDATSTTSKNQSLRHYSFAVLIVAIATAIGFLMVGRFALTNLIMVYLLGTLIVASRGFRGPAALASAVSVFAFDFFFVPPRYTFNVSDAQYFLTFAVMFTAAMVISHLTIRLRVEAESARQGEQRMERLYAFTQQLSGSQGTDNVLHVGVDHIARVFDSDVTALLPKDNKALDVIAQSNSGETIGDKERGTAQWVFESGQAAGQGTDSLPEGNALYIPLRGAATIHGVLRIHPRGESSFSDRSARQLLESFAHQMGLTLEVDRLQENTRHAELETETERLRSSLLSSVSHDFRTPLAAIVGSASTLLSQSSITTDPKAHELLSNIQMEGERLSRLVQNLLEATRLGTGHVQIKKEPYPLEEVIGSALEHLEPYLKDREVKIDLPENLPLVPLDGVLAEQLFINLFENVIRHTLPKTGIRLSAQHVDHDVEVIFADQGRGIPENERQYIFEKFYRGAESAGAGLGLAICKAIVEAHEGTIEAVNANGAVFKIKFPLEPSDGKR